MWAEAQPCSLALTIVYTPSISAPVTRPAPSTSAPRPSPIPRSPGISRAAAIAVPTAIGRLMKKIQCQLIASVRRPPASRPIEPPAEATKP